MNILFVCSFFPHPKCGHGTSTKVYNFIKGLSTENRVDLCCFATEEEKELSVLLKPFCSELKTVPLPKRETFKKVTDSLFSAKPRVAKSYFSLEFLEGLKYMLAKTHYDIVHFDISYVGQYIDYLDLPKGTKTILFEDDCLLFLVKGRREGAAGILRDPLLFIDYIKTRRYQPALWRKFDLILTITHSNKKTIEGFNHGLSIKVIPNGVDCAYFKRDSALSNEPLLIFTGNYWHRPNEDAVVYFIDRIYPKIKNTVKDIRLQLLGKNITPAIKKRVSSDSSISYGGFVDDVRPYLEKAAVFIAPIRTGKGMRGKVLEAMSMSIPVVSTELGLDGIGAQDKIHALLANEPGKFSEVTLEAIRDAALRKALGQNARILMESKYDWNIITGELEDTYKELLT